MQEIPFDSWVRKIPWRRDSLPTRVFLDFPVTQLVKNLPCNAGDLGSIPGLERSPEEGKSYPLQYSGLENSTDCIDCGVAESDMTERLSLSLQFQPNWSHGPQPCLIQWNYEPCHVGPPKQTGHGGEFWQNMVHWRSHWQTTSALLRTSTNSIERFPLFSPT